MADARAIVAKANTLTDPLARVRELDSLKTVLSRAFTMNPVATQKADMHALHPKNNNAIDPAAKDVADMIAGFSVVDTPDIRVAKPGDITKLSERGQVGLSKQANMIWANLAEVGLATPEIQNIISGMKDINIMSLLRLCHNNPAATELLQKAVTSYKDAAAKKSTDRESVS